MAADTPTGYGLGHTLLNMVARSIVDETIVPSFRAGDFTGGIDAGVDLMIRQVEGETARACLAAYPATAKSLGQVRFSICTRTILRAVHSLTSYGKRIGVLK